MQVKSNVKAGLEVTVKTTSASNQTTSSSTEISIKV